MTPFAADAASRRPSRSARSPRTGEGIGSAPDDAAPLEAVAAALEAVAVAFPAERRDFGPRRQAVIAANPELQEREALKPAGFAAAMTEALKARGIEDTVASLAAEIGVLALGRAYARWADPANTRDFAELAREALSKLQAAGAAL